MLKTIGFLLSAAGYIVLMFGGIFCLYLSFAPVIHQMSLPLWVLLWVFFPVTGWAVPLYDGFVLGDWTPLIATIVVGAVAYTLIGIGSATTSAAEKEATIL